MLPDDPVAGDTTCARLMGFHPERVQHIHEGSSPLISRVCRRFGARPIFTPVGHPVVHGGELFTESALLTTRCCTLFIVCLRGFKREETNIITHHLENGCSAEAIKAGTGLTHDMRALLAELNEHEDRRVRLVIEVFCYRARKYIGPISRAWAVPTPWCLPVG